MESVQIERYNATYNKIRCEPGVGQEISEYFTFHVPGYQFMPAYKNKMWDGKVRLFNTLTCLLYAGLNPYIEEFCKQRGYLVDYVDDFSCEEFSLIEAKEFVKSLAPKMEPRDYQLDAFVYAVRNRRALLLSPTASGKSFIIYLLVRYYASRTLVIVPTTSLVSQLASDFADYGFQSDKFVHRIFAGQDKHTDKPITISTWQSIYKMPKEYFEQFDVVIGDEAHLFKAKSLISIMEKLNNCNHRFGFTGTLDGTQTHKLVLEGVFGIVKRVTSTAELIEQQYLSEFSIKAIILKYPDEIRKLMKDASYQDEIDYIVRNIARNNFIKNLTLSLDGNTLLLFQFVEKHGNVLYENIKKEAGERKVYFVSGKVEGEEREQIRKIVETESNAIIVASYGTFSTGVNIRNLHNVIFASPSKSRIRNLQSIGRALRRSDTKTAAVLYDIADDISWKTRKNHTILHFVERMKIYNEEKFEYKIYTVGLKT
jgi:superfamily II DNA or RNA helicase